MVSPLAGVRHAIARSVLGDSAPGRVVLGTIVLRPHQVEAVARVQRAIADFGGALLADDPGRGKTFVALAVARPYGRAVVAAPAALRPMWRHASAAAGVPLTFLSLESLSRRDARAVAGLVIIDEAHHTNNPATSRYARVARLLSGAHALLLTATPVRNRRDELEALIALFLGPRARALDAPSLARIVVRRSAIAMPMPAVGDTVWLPPPRVPDFSPALRTLPPALPTLRGVEARALIAMTLARCWASSLAAFDASLRRRVQRGAALDAALEAGHLPTGVQLHGWLAGDDAVQLSFPQVVSGVAPNAAAMRPVLARHLDAVRTLRARILPHVLRDTRQRARQIERIRGRHGGAIVLAFAGHAATARALYAALRQSPGVVLLTSRGAHSAGGPRPRADVLDALGPRPTARVRPADDMRLLICTDVLNEGVNLQRASVVVHLDRPWTPAGLDQRVGRAARMGSPHDIVHVYGFAAPPGAERLLALGQRYLAKDAARADAAQPARDAERIRELLRPWLGSGGAASIPREACVRGGARAFIAVVRVGGGEILIAGCRISRRPWRVSSEPSTVRRVLEQCGSADGVSDERSVADARNAAGRWLSSRLARLASGLERGGASRARRRVLSRADEMLRRTPPHDRAAFDARLDRVLCALDGCAGAATEAALDRLAAVGTAGPAWLAELEALTATFRVRTVQRAVVDRAADLTPAVSALLVVVP